MTIDMFPATEFSLELLNFIIYEELSFGVYESSIGLKLLYLLSFWFWNESFSSFKGFRMALLGFLSFSFERVSFKMLAKVRDPSGF